jgi:hypothetical protein
LLPDRSAVIGIVGFGCTAHAEHSKLDFVRGVAHVEGVLPSLASP